LIRGLYTAATGLDAGMRHMDAISNNLANVGTSGFKREQVLFQSLLEREIYRYTNNEPPVYLGQLGSGVNFRLGTPDWGAGLPLATNNPLDIALIDGGASTADQLTFLAVETLQGGRAYTRNGQLMVDGEGFLRTMAGAYVLGHNPMGAPQRLRISDANELRIATDGTLIAANGMQLGRLYLVNPATDAQLTRLGNSLWNIEGEVMPAANPQVMQGYLEQANVQAVREMVNLITAMRLYETNAKIIQIQDETLNKAVNEVGRF